ncbi:hypothetical protein [Rhizobium anhuiense]|jgi:cytoskeletal protein CcmA (bactofilin family)
MYDLDAHIRGSISFDRSVRFHGDVEGDLTVSRGHTLELRGHVGRDLIVEEGASAIVGGPVGRYIVNKGGKVTLEIDRET